MLESETVCVLFCSVAQVQGSKMSLARALVGCKRVIDYAVKVRSRPLSPLACRVEMLLGDGLATCSITLLVGVTSMNGQERPETEKNV